MDLAALKILQFRFAKTMPHIPHEYVVRTPENQASYVELFNAVQQHGVLESFGRRRFRYWYAGDGFKYWTMTEDVAKSEIINRGRRVHPPLSPPRAAKRLPPHPPLRLPRQPRTRRNHRPLARTHRRRSGRPTSRRFRQPSLRRRRLHAVAKLLREHGDAKLTDLLETLANCPKAPTASVYDRCKAVYEGLTAH